MASNVPSYTVALAGATGAGLAAYRGTPPGDSTNRRSEPNDGVIHPGEFLMPNRSLLARVLGLSIACGIAVHAGTACAEGASPPSTTAPGALEEIVVSATKSEESIQRVPISITAYTQADLDASGAHTLGDIARLTPGVDFQQSSGFGTPQFNIAVRGISSSTSASTTNVYLDDTPLDSRTDQMSAAGAPFPRAFDLERVEVLRGPQGTLFGASAEGGAIRFITPTPNLREYSSYLRSEVSTEK